MSELNWNEIRRSLTVQQLNRFNFLCRNIAENKKLIELYDGFRKMFCSLPAGKASCELHWIVACYQCGELSRIDRMLKHHRLLLTRYRFALRQLLIEAGAIKPQVATVTVVPTVDDGWKNPVDRLFDSTTLKAPADSRKAAQDVIDNIRLLEAYSKERFGA